MTKLISIEGGDGVGKTSVVKVITQVLSNMGKEVINTREPGGTPMGEDVRALFKKKTNTICGMSEFLLIQAARIQHVKDVIRPAIEEGTWVICDRFHDSTEVYQGLREDVDQWVLNQYNTIFAKFVMVPDLTILLDCCPHIAEDRMVQRGTVEEDRLDSEPMERRVAIRNKFKEIAVRESKRIVVIDASQSEEKVAEDIKLVIKAFTM